MPLSGAIRRKPLTAFALLVIALGLAFFVFVRFTGVARAYPLAPGDAISAWDWQGAYRDGGANEAKTRADIARLSGKGKDYDAYVSIASDYELLGDGKDAYDYLSRAIALDPSRGLAYMNMGHLMEVLGALRTARAAYDAAVAAEPGNQVFLAARTDYLGRHPNNQ